MHGTPVGAVLHSLVGAVSSGSRSNLLKASLLPPNLVSWLLEIEIPGISGEEETRIQIVQLLETLRRYDPSKVNTTSSIFIWHGESA